MNNDKRNLILINLPHLYMIKDMNKDVSLTISPTFSFAVSISIV